MHINEIYDIADKEDIPIFNMKFEEQVSLSIPNAIAVDYSKIESTAHEKVTVTHETGHCVTGSYYNIYSPFDIRQKHENTADRWAIKKLLPFDEMREAMRSGYTEVWQLAEYFDVTEGFVRQACDYYINARGLDFNSPF